MSCDNCGDQAYTRAASIQLDIVQSICFGLEPGFKGGRLELGSERIDSILNDQDHDDFPFHCHRKRGLYFRHIDTGKPAIITYAMNLRRSTANKINPILLRSHLSHMPLHLRIFPLEFVALLD
jgi:hypothetical protein